MDIIIAIISINIKLPHLCKITLVKSFQSKQLLMASIDTVSFAFLELDQYYREYELWIVNMHFQDEET